MKVVQSLFRFSYTTVALLFLCCGATFVAFAGLELWQGLFPSSDQSRLDRFGSILESVALLTIAVVSLELGQTVLEEEVVRNAQMSAPTRIRRFLSRFLVVIVVALAIECLVAVFRLSHNDPVHLPAAASIGIAAGVILAAWGVFLRLNRSVEELEPEAMQEAKGEDHKVG